MTLTNPGDPVAADALLHVVADQLIADLRLGELDPTLVHLADDGAEHLRIGLKPLDGHHPTDLLLGFTAPAEWHAIGMATSGWAYAVADRGHGDRTRSRVHVVTLVSRTGELAHRLHVTDDHDLARALRALPDEASGEQVDLLRRTLGLPTDPPPCRTDAYWAIEWLSALLGADARDLDSWSAVIEHHPAMKLLGSDRSTDHGDDAFPVIASTFVRLFDWSRLRQLVADDRFSVPELVAADATWLDDGAFSRFVLNRCPPLTMLRPQAVAHVDPDLAERLEAALCDQGVPRSAWPDDIGGQAA